VTEAPAHPFILSPRFVRLTPVEDDLEAAVVLLHAALEVAHPGLAALEVKERRDPDDLVLHPVLGALDLAVDLEVAPVRGALGPLVPVVRRDRVQVPDLQARALPRLHPVHHTIVRGDHGRREVVDLVEPGVPVLAALAPGGPPRVAARALARRAALQPLEAVRDRVRRLAQQRARLRRGHELVGGGGAARAPARAAERAEDIGVKEERSDGDGEDAN
jgi:hypothetical protein